MNGKDREARDSSDCRHVGTVRLMFVTHSASWARGQRRERFSHNALRRAR